MNADILREFVRNGVCLSCGDGVLNSGEHIDPDRHAGWLAARDAETRRQALEEAVRKVPSGEMWPDDTNPAHFIQRWLRALIEKEADA